MRPGSSSKLLVVIGGLSRMVRDVGARKSWLRTHSSSPCPPSGLAVHRSIAIEANANHAIVTIFVDGFDALVTQIAERGIEPTERLTYRNGVRKALYHDPDGNEITFGGAPVPAE